MSSRNYVFTTRRGDSFNPDHDFKPGDIIFNPGRPGSTSMPNSNIYMYMKSTEKSHYLLRLLSFDFESYLSHVVTRDTDYGAVTIRERSRELGKRQLRLRHTCLAAQAAYPNPPGPEYAKQFQYYLSNYQHPDLVSFIHKSTSHIKDISGFLDLQKYSVDLAIGIIRTNLDLYLSFKKEKRLTVKEDEVFFDAYRHHLNYILPTSMPEPIHAAPDFGL